MELLPVSVFPGGEPENIHSHVEGPIKGGNGPDVKAKVLAGLDKTLKPLSKEGRSR